MRVFVCVGVLERERERGCVCVLERDHDTISRKLFQKTLELRFEL